VDPGRRLREKTTASEKESEKERARARGENRGQGVLLKGNSNKLKTLEFI